MGLTSEVAYGLEIRLPLPSVRMQFSVLAQWLVNQVPMLR